MARVGEVVVEAAAAGVWIGVEDVAGKTGIQDRERIRMWLKALGGRHVIAGPTTCKYFFGRKFT